MFGWIQARWARERARREHWKEFQALGLQDVRRRAESSIYDAEKLRHAWGWIHNREAKYQRRAFVVSVIAAIISLSALSVSIYSADNARKADRAWLGPSTIRLSQKPAVGKDLRFFLEYQNSGRQPAQDVYYTLDSYTYSKDMTTDVAERTKRFIASCKNSNLSEEKLTVFPGKGTFETYRVANGFVSPAVATGNDLIFINGCFVYRTLTETHRTAFCFKYDVKAAQEDDDGKPIMNLCNHGHYAD